MEAFHGRNLRLPDIIVKEIVEIPSEKGQQNRGQKNTPLSVSLLFMLKIPGHMAIHFSIFAC